VSREGRGHVVLPPARPGLAGKIDVIDEQLGHLETGFTP
jgi:hypothetical protein